MNQQPPQNMKRLVFLIVGLIDSLLGGAVVLIYFGVLPVDISGFGIPRWIVGLVGGIWFLSGFGVFVYQLMNVQREDE